MQVTPSTFEEDLDKGLFRSGAEYAKVTALQKAREVASRPWDEQDTPSLVIAADTVVELQGSILEKPNDAADAACMLSRCDATVMGEATDVGATCVDGECSSKSLTSLL